MARCSSTPSGEVLERQRQRARVVDQYVDRPDLVRERPHRRQVGDVEQPELDVALHLVGGGPAAVEVAHREHDLGAALGQHLRGLQADAAAGAGDDEPAAVLARDVPPALGARSGALPSTYATGSPRVTVRPTVQSRSWICWMVRGHDLAGRVAVLALGEGDVEGHLELHQVVAALVADLVALGARPERLERRALAGDVVEVGGAAADQRREQQLDRA